ncbi:hypothetical protein H0Z60_19800 [Ectothiorhodospiraceae bacterium WFHF3C12]|nr:hypothetical protein [Ectothiorhodospiraceae bacterium WFHF3C12]
MRTTDSDVRRVTQLLDLVEREDEHLRGVQARFFGTVPEQGVDGEWVTRTLSNPEGIDRLESFGAKFGRMQDTVVDKLLPALLTAAGEHPGAAIDNLNRAERLGFINAADDWLIMRRLRNRLVHEYMTDPSAMASALRQARALTGELHSAFIAMRDFASSHFS